MSNPLKTRSVVQTVHKRTLPSRLSAGQGTRKRKPKTVRFMFQFATPLGYRWVSWDGSDGQSALDDVLAVYDYPMGWLADILVMEVPK